MIVCKVGTWSQALDYHKANFSVSHTLNQNGTNHFMTEMLWESNNIYDRNGDRLGFFHCQIPQMIDLCSYCFLLGFYYVFVFAFV